MNEHSTNIIPEGIAHALLMIAPKNFHINPDTLSTNTFQDSRNTLPDNREIHSAACREFDGFVEALLKNHVTVHVFEGNSDCTSPDRIFPNNWVSFHQQHNMIYPMQPVNRRTERCQNIWDIIPKRYQERDRIDWSFHESEEMYLEGTGSLVLDRKNKIALAALSQRTHETLVRRWCQLMLYEPILFIAKNDNSNVPIYHTNVVASVSQHALFIALDCISGTAQKKQIQDYAEKTNKTLVPLTQQQTRNFAGNILEFFDIRGSSCIAISSRALKSYSRPQLKVLERAGNIIQVDLSNIERYGGGSARCMLAELF